MHAHSFRIKQLLIRLNDRKQTATNVPGRNQVETRNKSETSKLLFKTGIRITDEWIRTHLEKEKKKKSVADIQCWQEQNVILSRYAPL